jgi:hypothetical protein
MKTPEENPEAEMLDSYDFSQGVRGKYVERLKSGSNFVVLDPDVAEIFPDERSVNQALRALAAIIVDRQKTRVTPA